MTRPAPPRSSRPRKLRRQAGVTLIEALVALLIMAFGMVAMVGLQGNMRRSADFAKQRSEAVRLAQQEMETLRAYAVLDRDENTHTETLSFDQIVDATRSDAGDVIKNASYTLTRDVSTSADGTGGLVDVRVEWVDRAGNDQVLRLRSYLLRVDPRLSAAVTVPPDGAPTRRPKDRAVGIPAEAKDLGDGRSVFKPPSSGGVAWVFNNLSGSIVSRCTGFAPDTLTSAISAADVAANCNNAIAAYLLSGHVRFSIAAPPDAEAPNSPALPLDMVVDVTPPEAHPVPAYQCFDDAPPSALNSQTEGVRYYCAVYPNSATPPNWSGSLRVTGISLAAADYKICRYSADYDGNGSIGNAEHPQQYTAVSSSLGGQNFLVVQAASACPSGHPYDPANGHYFNSATVQHQP